jgi:hypothetical protein
MNGCRNPRLLALVHYAALAMLPYEDINNPKAGSSVSLPRQNGPEIACCLKLWGLRVGGTQCATQTALYRCPDIDWM